MSPCPPLAPERHHHLVLKGSERHLPSDGQRQVVRGVPVVVAPIRCRPRLGVMRRALAWLSAPIEVSADPQPVPPPSPGADLIRAVVVVLIGIIACSCLALA